MRQVVGLVAATIAALTLGAAALVGWLALASLPERSGAFTLPGLEAAVSVRRDGRGIPLIEASHPHDAAMALGFVHAQDRLWQMEMSRRIGAGRLAEILGEPALGTDRFMRTLGLYRAAEAALPHLSPAAVATLEAYARGVNAVIERPWWRLPPEFLLLRHRPEPWRPADSLVLVKTMALSLVESWRAELVRAAVLRELPATALADLWPEPRPDAVVTIPDGMGARAGPTGPTRADAAELLPDDVKELAGSLLAALPGAAASGLGSNIWAIGGEHTASGAALLANDPHLGLSAPATWYLAAMRTPEGFVMGATLPALPVVVIGRNESIAWGFTNTGGDTDDLFVERLDPDEPERYLTPDGFRPFVVRNEQIAIRGAEPVLHRVRETRHGPVISDVLPAAAETAGADHVLALRWVALEPDDRTLEAGLALAAARDPDAFRGAIELFLSPAQNAFYADGEGRIGVRLAGRLPLRRTGDGSLPVPGWSGAFDWEALLPMAANPEAFDPPRGFLLNANNRLVDNRLAPFVTAHWNDDLRARRIEALLQRRIATAPRAAPAALDIEAMRRLQRDRHSMLARDFLPWLLDVEPRDRREAEILQALGDWDGESRPDRPEPLVFQAWYRALVHHVLVDDLGASFDSYRGIRSDAMRHILETAPEWCDDRNDADQVQDCGTMATRAFASAVDELVAEWGDDWRGWRWGEAARARLGHRPFDAIGWLRHLFSLAAVRGGDAGTVDVARYSQSEPYSTVVAASLRLVADLAEPAGLHVVLPTGQSGHPLSPHYADQMSDWVEGRLLPFDIASNAWEDHLKLLLLPAAEGQVDVENEIGPIERAY